MLNREILKIAFLSTSPPRECGLATFTQDLIDAIDEIGTVSTAVIAVNNEIKREYGDKVIFEINQNVQKEYKELADKINHSDIDLLVIEHEFGIYGGEFGIYILDLINGINIPVITTLHTILREPNEKQKHIIKTLGEKSVKMVTMAKNTRELLATIYEVPLKKIEVIHHGVPFEIVPARKLLKEKFGYSNKQVISTFGLLSPGKGIEYGVKAIAKSVTMNPDILYLIIGKTHPDQKDESYRKMLQMLVTKYHVEENVKFINKYLTKDEIIQYLQLSDVYMTPYLSKDQAVSGTLAYAVGYGRAIISTPYLYAKEMLSEERGLLAEFRDANSLSNCINYILQNKSEKIRMEDNTRKLGHTMYWPMIAEEYNSIFLQLCEQTQKVEVANV